MGDPSRKVRGRYSARLDRDGEQARRIGRLKKCQRETQLKRPTDDADTGVPRSFLRDILLHLTDGGEDSNA